MEPVLKANCCLQECHGGSTSMIKYTLQKKTCNCMAMSHHFEKQACVFSMSVHPCIQHITFFLSLELLTSYAVSYNHSSMSYFGNMLQRNVREIIWKLCFLTGRCSLRQMASHASSRWRRTWLKVLDHQGKLKERRGIQASRAVFLPPWVETSLTSKSKQVMFGQFTKFWSILWRKQASMISSFICLNFF